ncbi:MAG: hypothetical protein WDO14_23395 [Bacteroidota bacterium]
MAKRKNPSDEQDKDKENLNDDSFGLPDLDYKPLETPQEETTTTTTSSTFKEEVKSEPVAENTYSSTETKRETKSSTYKSYMDEEEEEEKSRAPVIVGIVVALAVAVAALLYYFYVYKPQQLDKARIAKEAEDLRLKEQEAARLREAEEAAKRQRAADSIAALSAKPAIGTIETLTDRTKRYYVVVTSAIDGDLVMDYAKRLSAKGISTKIIPPFGNYKFSRLAIGDYDTFANAQASADAAKADYGGAVWVLKF